jgi:hypothetical protein
MDRRGFMSLFNNLFGSGREQGKTLFFGLQVVIGFESVSDPRREIYGIVSEYVGKEGISEKKVFYSRIREALDKLSSTIEYVYWDYITDPEAAASEFDQWTAEIQDESIAETDNRQDEGKGHAEPTKEYVVLTQVFLLKDHSSMEKFFSKIESIPENLYFARSSIVKLIYAIELIDFSHCAKESLFLMPAGKKEGYTKEELEGEGWEYLHKL